VRLDLSTRSKLGLIIGSFLIIFFQILDIISTLITYSIPDTIELNFIVSYFFNTGGTVGFLLFKFFMTLFLLLIAKKLYEINEKYFYLLIVYQTIFMSIVVINNLLIIF